MAPTIEMSRRTLLERRAAVLRRIGTDEAGFAETRATRSLSSDEWEAKEELEEIGFLLGADD
ncbi:hypothetical protein ACO03V_01565 [Microbacterium sp. HMH0099]|uniref:hypothetical protein n=1 Tax=Microbacterium sp. HMH0099 TaxID=3414026 RepID=UPI003BF71F83